MNLLDIVQQRVSMRRVGAKSGVEEWHGPCPSCGTGKPNPAMSDRFSVKVNANGDDQWFCRNCGNGDTIAYLMKFDGLSFPAACKEVGKELPEQEEFQAPHFKKPSSDNFQPRIIAAPVDAWVEHATKFITWAHEQLLANQEQQDYLAARGITIKSIVKHKLGYNPGENGKDLYKAREEWGLETVMNGNKKKKLWLPIGIVIPWIDDSILRRVRIRIPNDRRTEQFSLPYYLVPGSSMDTFVTNPESRAFAIIEAELDAIMIDEQAGDLTGTMAMGNSTAKPTDGAYQLLTGSLHISNALDYDAKTSESGKYENAGGIGWLWWPKQFPQAERWPVPVGKDPGDAFKAGVNIREWIKAGLPPVLTLPPPPKQSAKPASLSSLIPHPSSDAQVQDIKTGADFSAAAPEGEKRYSVTMRTTADGITYHITNSPEEYSRLIATGAIVFNFTEMSLVIKSGANQQQAKNFLIAKQTFPGIRLTEVITEQPKEMI
ncbi:MAG: hypothetical protein PHN84_12780 [Desulfuromonadaceae bacterium]|nr:hypothetical protein [Desulfuromonadaceae bacterium]